MLRCAEDTCADTSHVAKSACVTTLRLRGWEKSKNGRSGVRPRSHARARGLASATARALGDGVDLAARRSASGIDPRGVASVVPAPFDRDIPRRQKRRLLGGGGKRSRAGVGRRARDDAPGSLRRPRRAGSFDETRRDASRARRERGVPRAVVRDPFADPFAADLLAPAPVRGGHSEARGSAGARPHAEPPWDPFAPARAPPPVAAHYAHPEADLEASLASDRRKRPPGPDRHPPSRAAHYEVSDDEPPVPRARRDRPREGRRQGGGVRDATERVLSRRRALAVRDGAADRRRTGPVLRLRGALARRRGGRVVGLVPHSQPPRRRGRGRGEGRRGDERTGVELLRRSGDVRRVGNRGGAAVAMAKGDRSKAETEFETETRRRETCPSPPSNPPPSPPPPAGFWRWTSAGGTRCAGRCTPSTPPSRRDATCSPRRTSTPRGASRTSYSPCPGTNVFAGRAGATTGRSRTGASPRTRSCLCFSTPLRARAAVRSATRRASPRVWRGTACTRTPTPRSIPRRAKPRVFARISGSARPWTVSRRRTIVQARKRPNSRRSWAT